MPKPLFTRDDYFKMLDKLLGPEAGLPQQPLILERLRESIRKRQEFGPELELRVNGSLLGRS